VPTLAATPHHIPGVLWLVLAVVLLLWLAGYLLACTLWPFAACQRCDGGKRRSPSGRAWRKCRRCKGSGARLRIGRRAINWVRRTGKEAAR
jgi:hypothetical protein